jgi:hypothetical protein
VSVEVLMLKVTAEPGLLAMLEDIVIEATLPASSFVPVAKVTTSTVVEDVAPVQVGVRSAPSLVQRVVVAARRAEKIAALAVMVTVPAAGTSVVGVNHTTRSPPAVACLILSILAAPPHVTDPDEVVSAVAAVAGAAATTVTTGPLVAPTAAPPVPVPAFTSAAVGAAAPSAYTAHRTFSVNLLVRVMSSIVPPRAVPVDAGCELKPAVY